MNEPSGATRLGAMLGAFFSAVGFLTRIPLPARLLGGSSSFAQSSGFFAWVGWIIALVLATTTQLTPWLGPRLAALCAVAVWAWLTGGLHLDGVADCFDGLSGGRGDPSRALQIMRDSRIGAHGATALALVLALKWAALERCLAAGTFQWLAVPVAARWLCTLQIALFPYAREEGLGSSLHGEAGVRAMGLGLVALAPAAALATVQALWFVPACVLFGLFVGTRIHRALGGLTGDAYGASIELVEVFGLLLCGLDLR